MIKIILVLAFLTRSSLSLDARPVFFIHGLGETCPTNKDDLPKNITCLETGGGLSSYFSIFGQIKNGCNEIKRHVNDVKHFPHILSTGFYIVAHSQGGLIARGLLIECSEYSDLIKGIITIGTPNMGLDRLPKETLNQLEDKNTPWFVKSVLNFAQGVNDGDNWDMSIAPLQYLNAIKKTPFETEVKFNKITIDEKALPTMRYVDFNSGYFVEMQLEYMVKGAGSFISYLIEKFKDPKYSENLEFMMALMLTQDKMVEPIASQTFGATYWEKNHLFKRFDRTQAYTENLMNLRNLYDERRLTYCAAETGHNSINTLLEKISKLFTTSNCPDEGHEYQRNPYKFCVMRKYINTNFYSEYHCNNYWVSKEKQATEDLDEKNANKPRDKQISVNTPALKNETLIKEGDISRKSIDHKPPIKLNKIPFSFKNKEGGESMITGIDQGSTMIGNSNIFAQNNQRIFIDPQEKDVQRREESQPLQEQSEIPISSVVQKINIDSLGNANPQLDFKKSQTPNNMEAANNNMPLNHEEILPKEYFDTNRWDV